MNDDAYDAFCESVPEVDGTPVRFQFTESEVEQFDIPEDWRCERTVPFSDEVIWNLEERGRPYIRAALIFQVFSERLK